VLFGAMAIPQCSNQSPIYLSQRRFEGPIAQNKSSGLSFMDEMNPRLISNNLLIPYVIAVWEEYFRTTFAATLKYTNARDSVLKRARLAPTQLEKIIAKDQPTELTIAESFSFQRPRIISENFKLLDPKLDLGGALRKPYKRRKQTLFDSIDDLVSGRNAFVHRGQMNMELYDEMLKTVLDDVIVAVDRCYGAIASNYGFVAMRGHFP